ncbi:unnamed protein product [Acanthoscelides obtectus]|uniref:Phosphatidylinositol N-acetylglucosaminyltransferase subunit H conserved domain-containing protein n=1 Tax=Acanthoscelides obtectus TaxID=200917 RepID=A0A9P0NV99_ACAOB|nr:unnamed protein product [Acanthoscelides obtectus]CAK1621889.1 Phosphatidylinositol N-acetylglucosaminyltransferase subunit H [Acanthoscelides obtectus]
MVRHKRKEKFTTFENVYGNKLQLYLENRDGAVRIRLTNTLYDIWFRKSILLLAIAALNLSCLVYDIICKKLIIVVFFGALYMFFKLLCIVREGTCNLSQHFDPSGTQSSVFTAKTNPTPHMRGIRIKRHSTPKCKISLPDILVMVHDLGMQLKTKYLLNKSSKFIPNESIQHIFINEVIFRSKIIYTLNLLLVDIVTKEERILPLFHELLPRLSCLEVIYKNIRKKCH